MKIEVVPLKKCGDVVFGMKRNDVRKLLGNAKEFLKATEGTITTDNFGYCHVYYDENDECEAIEYSWENEVFLFGEKIFPVELDRAMKLVPYAVRDRDGIISKPLSIGIYAPCDEMEGILFGKPGYYDKF